MRRLLIVVLALLSASMAAAQEAGQNINVILPTGNGVIASGGTEVTGRPDAPVPSEVNEVGKQLAYAAKNTENCYSYPEPARTQCFEREVTNVNSYLVKYHMVVNNVGLTKQGLYMFLKDHGLLKSGPATWGKDEVDFCISQGILYGRAPGTTSQSKEWQTACTREEFAAGLARVTRAFRLADAAEAAVRIKGDTDEAATRQGADTALGQRIDWETAARIVHDNELAVGILVVCLIIGVGFMFLGLAIRRRHATV